MPLPASTQWLTPQIEAAFRRSGVLWLENPEYNKSSPEVMNGVAEVTRQTAVSADYFIFDALDRDSATRLEKVLVDEGLPPNTLAGRGPRDVRQWLSAIADKRTGADHESIPEVLFRRRATESGKMISTEWKDLLEVVTWSAAAAPDVQLDVVRMALDDIARAGTYQAELASWLSGELTAQTKVAEGVARKYPRLYRRMSIERNAKLAEGIASHLNAGTAQFVCVGILHLLGPGSLPEQLSRLGMDVVRA